MKIRNKTAIGGAPTLPMDKSSGKFFRSGSGTSVLNWVIICIQRLCVSLSLRKPKQHPIPLPHPKSPPPRVERESALHQNSGPDTAEQSEEQTSPALKDPHHQSDPPVIYGAPAWAATSRAGIFAGADFEPQPDGTLRCPTNHPLYPQERRAEQDGTVRIVYAARIRDCRACGLRVQCLAHGNEAKHARRVSAVLRPIEGPSPPPEPTVSPGAATQPILWGDWSRCQTRRRLMSLLRTQTVTITLPPATDPGLSAAERGPLTRQQRKHARLTWEQRLARNALSASEPGVKLHLFGIPPAFAQAIGLPSVA